MSNITHIMRKQIYLLAVLLLPCMAFAQSDLPFTSLKPFNKGNFKIDVSYSRMMQKQIYASADYPDFRVDIGYGITNWCVVGVFGSYGSNKSFVITGGEIVQDDTVSYTNPVVWDEQIYRYYHYGIDAELHPLSLLLPNFYFIDVYCRGELGMRTIADRYVPTTKTLILMILPTDSTTIFLLAVVWAWLSTHRSISAFSMNMHSIT